ncbi:hypothetical protein BDQ94DRAFT_151085 [Aspergillus welwitschiae]|uniref:Secreted protein n=1 Tax=Aspergillus welwitschiae TaxID=1341132 RepID=A0A3F3PQX9_9EURO|nr:hypothetical protein BDQ94DRAFT_151085 [Aspergillus welwitschiae]RDH29152.1 hypothetical protein BDQ94DRAFT_151085 [Aspergillus welwitschiae]
MQRRRLTSVTVYIQCAIAIVLAHGANASGYENYLPVTRANCTVAPSSRPPKCRTDDLNLNLEVTRVVCCPVGWRSRGKSHFVRI